MKKKTALILTIVLLVLGSFVTFYVANLLFSDVSNAFYKSPDKYIIATFPLFMFSIDFIIGIIFVIRFYRYPQYKKAMINLYTILIASMSLVGIVTSIITGTFVYHSFVKPYPFACATLIAMLLHIILLGASVYINIVARKKLEDDKEKKHQKLHNILYTTFLSLMLFLSLYKLGTVLWAPFYVHLRSLYLTWPFYVWSLLPMALVAHVIMYFFDLYKKYTYAIIYISVLLLLNIGLGICVMAIGYTHPLFISAISPALPLERLATKPLDVITVFVLLTGLCVYYLIYSIRSVKLAKTK